jgi:hypothetical protein
MLYQEKPGNPGPQGKKKKQGVDSFFIFSTRGENPEQK